VKEVTMKKGNKSKQLDWSDMACEREREKVEDHQNMKNTEAGDRRKRNREKLSGG